MIDKGQIRQVVMEIIALLEQEAVKLGAPPDALKAYTESSYGDGIYDAAAAFWKEGSRGNFNTRMNALIKFGLNDAWKAGAKAAGVEPDEFEPEDDEQIAALIAEEKSHVSSLLDFLDGLANTPGASLQQAEYRLRMWVSRWHDVYTQALVWFGKKIKLVWVLGQAEHCTTCSALSGIVAWAREWEEADIRPQSDRLECHGYNCKCSLVETRRRRSPKALDRIRRILGE